jgi:hypothetical protein
MHLFVVVVLIFGAAAFIAGRFSRLRLAWRVVILTTYAGYVTSQIFFQDCVLTSMEKQLQTLSKAGWAYRSSFFENYFPFLAKITDRYGAQIGAISVVLLIGMVWRVSYLRWNRATSIRVVSFREDGARSEAIRDRSRRLRRAAPCAHAPDE